MQGFSNRFYLKAQILISLKASSFIDVKSALLNAVLPNKNLSLGVKYRIYRAYNISNLICHLLTFKYEFEAPLYFGQRAFQKPRKTPSSMTSPILVIAQSLKELLVLLTPVHTTSVGSLATCPENSTSLYSRSREYDSQGDQEDKEASQDEELKIC
ncbi:hypothetical protein DSO57_1027332 [Entomophthora muscae]|uniref:Uncharacterized protein n=1 Tax=Entomophthora muscae TaxID=34485 RepID=A0ACC2T1U6_9FUNG|nr:hypothetical protein DSO57_1027332 [Entomophthora muscae]